MYGNNRTHNHLKWSSNSPHLHRLDAETIRSFMNINDRETIEERIQNIIEMAQGYRAQLWINVPEIIRQSVMLPIEIEE